MKELKRLIKNNSRSVKINPSFHLRRINDMLNDKRYTFSYDYLLSIKKQIEEDNRISTKQIKAIQNIKRSTN